MNVDEVYRLIAPSHYNLIKIAKDEKIMNKFKKLAVKVAKDDSKKNICKSIPTKVA